MSNYRFDNDERIDDINDGGETGCDRIESDEHERFLDSKNDKFKGVNDTSPSSHPHTSKINDEGIEDISFLELFLFNTCSSFPTKVTLTIDSNITHKYIAFIESSF